MKTTDPPIIIEQTFNTSIDHLWNVITEVDQMTQWFFENIPAFEPVVGFKTQFVVENQGRTFTHLWEITGVAEEQKIVYRWSYVEYPGIGRVTFAISGSAGEAHLTLTNEILEDFAQDIPEFTRESCIGGWRYFINARLKNYLSQKSAER